MGFRVDRIEVKLTIYEELVRGRNVEVFAYVPKDNDPLVREALVKLGAIRDEELKQFVAESKNDPDNLSIF